MSVVVMEDQSQPVFRDFLGPGPAPNSELKQPELSATDSVRVSQNSGFMEQEDGEASVRSGSRFAAPCPSAGPGANVPASSDPGAEMWRQSRGGVPFTKNPGMNDEARKRDEPGSRAACFRENLLHESVEGSRPTKRFNGTGTNDLGLSMQPPRASQAGMNSAWFQTSVFKADPSTGSSKRLEPSRPVVNAAVPLPRSNPNGSAVGAFPRNSGAAAVMQVPPADEGSRTGLQGGGIAALINNNPAAAKLPASGRLSGADGPALERSVPLERSKLPLQTAGSDPILPSHKPPTSITRQLTIFYGGQAHVFDDVSPDKADAIMALAGSNGRSWSTTYAHRSSRSEGSLGDMDRRREKVVNGSSSVGMSADMQNILHGLNQAGGQARKHHMPKAPSELPPATGSPNRFGVANGRAPGLPGSFYSVKETANNPQMW